MACRWNATRAASIYVTTVTNVRFDRVGWRNWIVQASRLADPSFRAADLRDSHFDGRNGYLADDPVLYPVSRYQRCDFTRTRTGPYASWGHGIVEECLFNSTKLTSPNWFYGAELRPQRKSPPQLRPRHAGCAATRPRHQPGRAPLARPGCKTREAT